jgi:tetratricopeptide (TPR) repeat protein
VFGREFSAVLLAQALDRSDSAILGAIDEAVQLRLLTEISGPPHHYRYAHVLVRDVLYEGIPRPERAQMHGRVGAALEARCPDPAELSAELAYHFSAEGTPSGIEKAVGYHAMAGELAAARFDSDAALEHYRSALRLLESLPAPDARRGCDLRIRLGVHSRSMGLVDAAAKTWLQAAEHARAVKDHGRLVRVALAFSAAYDSHGYLLDRNEMRPLLLEAIRCSDGCDDAERSTLFSRLAYVHEVARAREAAEEASGRARQLAKACGDPLAMAEVLVTEHLRRRGTAAARERCEIAVELIRHAERADHPGLQLSYWLHRAADLAALGDFEGWAIATDAHARLAARIKSAESIAVSYRNSAMRARMRGQFAEARSLSERALALGQHCEPAILNELGHALFAVEGETSGPSPIVMSYLSKAKPTPARFVSELWAYTQLERPDLVRDKLAPVMIQIREHHSHFNNLNRPYHVALIAEAAAFVHDLERAEEALEWLDGFEELHVIAGIGGVYAGPALRYIALIQAAFGRWR